MSILKSAALAAILAFPFAARPAIADDAHPTEPKLVCGKTVEDCQKAVDALKGQIELAAKRAGAYRQLLIEANDRLAQQAAK